MIHAFISSSNRENSTYRDALRNFKGPRHQQLIDDAKAHGVKVTPGVGYWHDGAEETTHIRGPEADEVAEKLGRKYGQKQVLLFSETQHGPDKMWHFKGHAVSKVRHLSPFLTVTPHGIHVVETEATPEFEERAKALGGTSKPGKAVFRELS